MRDDLDFKETQHGRNHRPGGPDQIPGLPVFITEKVRATAGHLVFDAIPTTFRHLRIVAELQCVNATTLAMTYNGDTDPDYDSAWHHAFVNASTPTGIFNGGSWQITNFKWSFVSSALAGDGDSWAHVTIDIPYYQGPRYKQALVAIASAAGGEFYSVSAGGRWLVTDPVTEIDLFGGSNPNLVAGSRASLYGIA